MTEQYQEQDINGQPSPLSLVAIPLVIPVPGGVDTDAIFWPSLAADAVIVGNGIEVAGDAASGSIIQFTAPGLYEATLVLADTVAGGFPVNMLRGVTAPITAPAYPSLDFLAAAGVEDIAFIVVAAPDNGKVRATFRITGTDLVDPTVGINPNRQLRFSYPSASILTIAPPGTRLAINRVSR